MRRDLVILSTNFGINFSGGTLATHEAFCPIQKSFGKVVFVGKRLGNHRFENLSFLRYKNIFHAVSLIRSLRRSLDKPVFFADFYMAYFFIIARVPYYFAYHDNWPELAKAGNSKDRFKGLIFNPLYRLIIKKSDWTFTVSNFKMSFVQSITNRCSLVRNGVSYLDSNSGPIQSESKAMAMVGNLDTRKYGKSIELFEKLRSIDTGTFEIHIHGHIINQELATRLESFSFVKLRGFSDEIPWRGYKGLLTTSSMENLSISVVEALKHEVPVLGYAVGGLPEVVQNGVNGFLFPTDQSDLLSQKLGQLISGACQFQFEKNALKDFDWQKASKSYQKVLLSE